MREPQTTPRVLVHLLCEYPEETIIDAIDRQDEAHPMDRARKPVGHTRNSGCSR